MKFDKKTPIIFVRIENGLVAGVTFSGAQMETIPAIVAVDTDIEDADSEYVDEFNGEYASLTLYEPERIMLGDTDIAVLNNTFGEGDN